MTGRGVDQILQHPSSPELYEPYVGDARDYVRLAEQQSGPIPRGAAPNYVWGDALGELSQLAPDARIVNLETGITRANNAWAGKGIHYRMHPKNASVLRAAAIDCCVLANNHVLDWGYEGLLETLDTLARQRLAYCGAGRDLNQARQPAACDFGARGRLLVFAVGVASSGIPAAWLATDATPGVWRLDSVNRAAADAVAAQIAALRHPGDTVIVSIHWGGNWGFAIPEPQKAFARALVDAGAADIVHGHSSHHIKGFEVYKDRLILYGCGDFLNDYEGITGQAEYRGDLSAMYFPRISAASGALLELVLVPMQTRRLRLQRPDAASVKWIADTLNREGRALGTGVRLRADGRLEALWAA